MSNAKTINILIVDDMATTNALLRGVVMHIIDTHYHQYHYKVFQAYKGKTALEIMHKNTIDLAFLDIELPDQNGFSLLNIFGQDFPHCKSIMVSVHGTRENVVTAIAQGVLGFIVKPFNKPRVKEPLDKFMKEFQKRPKPGAKSNKDKLIDFVRQNYG